MVGRFENPHVALAQVEGGNDQPLGGVSKELFTETVFDGPPERRRRELGGDELPKRAITGDRAGGGQADRTKESFFFWAMSAGVSEITSRGRCHD